LALAASAGVTRLVQLDRNSVGSATQLGSGVRSGAPRTTTYLPRGSKRALILLVPIERAAFNWKPIFCCRARSIFPDAREMRRTRSHGIGIVCLNGGYPRSSLCYQGKGSPAHLPLDLAKYSHLLRRHTRPFRLATHMTMQGSTPPPRAVGSYSGRLRQPTWMSR